MNYCYHVPCGLRSDLQPVNPNGSRVLCCSFYCSGYWYVVDALMWLRSSPSITAMAEARILLNLLRWTAADSGEVLVIVLGRTENSALLYNACSMLLLKVAGLVLLVLMMVVDKGRFALNFEKVGSNGNVSFEFAVSFEFGG
jgi:hypothetical protein